MSLRFACTLGVLFVLAVIAAFYYAPSQGIPTEVAIPVAAALFFESACYATLAFSEIRVRWTRAALIASAVVPYLIYSIPTGFVSLRSVALIVVAGALVTYWYRFVRLGRVSDLVFLAVMASPLLFKWFDEIYTRPHEEARLEILGQLAWIRLGVLAVLRDRQQPGVGFGFIPTGSEWRTGLLFYLCFLPAFGVAQWMGFLSFGRPGVAPWQLGLAAVGTFFGILWVVALSEEFFFRGLLQQWMTGWLRNAAVALVVTSVIFGAAHLGFRQFPNWQMAGFAAVAGVVYGLAFRQGGGIRAAMVTHALVVTTWRTLFR